jgi:hypothetical protein
MYYYLNRGLIFHGRIDAADAAHASCSMNASMVDAKAYTFQTKTSLKVSRN